MWWTLIGSTKGLCTKFNVYKKEIFDQGEGGLKFIVKKI